jgi:hypothetical protein
MAYRLKSQGRTPFKQKVRSFKGITPKGFKFLKVDKKRKFLIYKRID